MVSGSDEHGTPITVTAETQGISPQEVVDKYHEINTKALMDLVVVGSQTSITRPELEALCLTELATLSTTKLFREFHETDGCWTFRAKSNATILRD